MYDKTQKEAQKAVFIAYVNGMLCNGTLAFQTLTELNNIRIKSTDITSRSSQRSYFYKCSWKSDIWSKVIDIPRANLASPVNLNLL